MTADTHRLVPLERHPYAPMYHLQGLPGTMPRPYLAELAEERLFQAAEYLRCRYSRLGALNILVWDGYRSQVTQQAVFDRYLEEVRRDHPDWDDEAVRTQVLRFVAGYWRIFPHGTGGTADVTLALDGQEAWMGTEFDDFSEAASPAWFQRRPPRDERERSVAERREALREAMLEGGGFVGHPEEWWHFEYGTARWARGTGQDVIFDRVLLPPNPA